MNLRAFIIDITRKEVSAIIRYNDGLEREFKVYDFYFLKIYRRTKETNVKP